MRQIIDESLKDLKGQIEQTKANLNQLLGAESVLKLILEADEQKELEAKNKIITDSELSESVKQRKTKKSSSISKSNS